MSGFIVSFDVGDRFAFKGLPSQNESVETVFTVKYLGIDGKIRLDHDTGVYQVALSDFRAMMTTGAMRKVYPDV